MSDRLLAFCNCFRFSWEKCACLGFILEIPTLTGMGLEPVCKLIVPPRVEIPSSSAIVFKLLTVMCDLDFLDVLRTISEMFERLLLLSQMWLFPWPISLKHFEHIGSTLAGGEIGVERGVPTGFE